MGFKLYLSFAVAVQQYSIAVAISVDVKLIFFFLLVQGAYHKLS